MRTRVVHRCVGAREQNNKGVRQQLNRVQNMHPACRCVGLRYRRFTHQALQLPGLWLMCRGTRHKFAQSLSLLCAFSCNKTEALPSGRTRSSCKLQRLWTNPDVGQANTAQRAAMTILARHMRMLSGPQGRNRKYPAAVSEAASVATMTRLLARNNRGDCSLKGDQSSPRGRVVESECCIRRNTQSASRWLCCQASR